MNEPKRRGRPPAAKPCPDCGQAVGHYDDCPVGITGPRVNGDTSGQLERAWKETLDVTVPDIPAASIAQAYALRIWHGQDTSELRAWRVARVKAALEGQGLSMESVVLP